MSVNASITYVIGWSQFREGSTKTKFLCRLHPLARRVAFPIESRSSDVISIKEDAMVRVGLFVRLQAKLGKEAEVARFSRAD